MARGAASLEVEDDHSARVFLVTHSVFSLLAACTGYLTSIYVRASWCTYYFDATVEEDGGMTYVRLARGVTDRVVTTSTLKPRTTGDHLVLPSDFAQLCCSTFASLASFIHHVSATLFVLSLHGY